MLGADEVDISSSLGGKAYIIPTLPIPSARISGCIELHLCIYSLYDTVIVLAMLDHKSPCVVTVALFLAFPLPKVVKVSGVTPFFNPQSRLDNFKTSLG
jgi:hypothetical protein